MSRPQIRYPTPIPVHEIILPGPRVTSQSYPPQSYPPSHTQASERPTGFQRVREYLRAPLAEFLGVGLFVLIGTASDCQAILTSNSKVSPISKGTFLSLDFGWATGAALGVWISAGISGAHINPAMTLAMACANKFPWKKVPVYIFAQVAGGFVGAATTYAQYLQAINIYEGSPSTRTTATAGLFASFPFDYLSPLPLFTSELIGTGILALMIVATTDKQNAAPDLSLLPIAVFIIVLALGVSWGMETFSFNPARDLGCRLLLSIVGYGLMPFTYHGFYWFWGGFLAPTLGAIIAIIFYDLFLRRPMSVHTIMSDDLKADINAL